MPTLGAAPVRDTAPTTTTDEAPLRSGLVGLLLAVAADALVVGVGAAAGGVHMARNAASYPTLYAVPELAAGAVMLALAVLLPQVARVGWTRSVDWRLVLLAFCVAVLPLWKAVVWLAGTVATSLR